MTLYLTSRGFGSPCVGEKIFSHLKKEAKELRLFYIPTARYGYSRKNKLIEGLEAAGFQKEQIIWFDHRYPERYGDEIPDLIYVCGGNIFLLQHYMKESGFLPKLKGWIEAGVPYVGASAGTHLIEQSIEHLKYFDENKIGETDFAGLGLFLASPFAIMPKNGKKSLVCCKRRGNILFLSSAMKRCCWQRGRRVTGCNCAIYKPKRAREQRCIPGV